MEPFIASSILVIRPKLRLGLYSAYNRCRIKTLSNSVATSANDAQDDGVSGSKLMGRVAVGHGMTLKSIT